MADKEVKKEETGGEDLSALDKIYSETGHWSVNLGEKTIHAKRMDGRFRRIKWYVASIYLLYFIGPFLRWDGRQAILFDIPARKYYLFGFTFWPQDVWMLSLLLLTFFMTLFAVTAFAGRVFCGYICWQTVWVDVYTWIEEKLEGEPSARRALDAAPWTSRKVGIKAAKHSIWLALSALTGITFTAFFIDVFELWGRYFSLQGPVYIWAVPAPFLIGSYIGVGFMREQICFWLCPYARIQGVMTDVESLIPTYDYRRGEPRGKIRKGGVFSGGDCVDCNMCVAVCPMGVDIRNGLQEGCITCGLCIDACDMVMEKTGRQKGLISYLSLNQLRDIMHRPWLKRPRSLVYTGIIILAVIGILYGVGSRAPFRVAVLHERNPLFTRMSDGSIQNSYTVKITNRTGEDNDCSVMVTGVPGRDLAFEALKANTHAGKVTPFTIRLKAMEQDLTTASTPISIELFCTGQPESAARTISVFMGPEK